MGAGPIPPGGVELNARGGVMITDSHTIRAGALNWLPGAVPGGPGEVTAQVVDMAKGTETLLTFDVRIARNIHQQLGELIAKIDGAGKDAEV